MTKLHEEAPHVTLSSTPTSRPWPKGPHGEWSQRRHIISVAPLGLPITSVTDISQNTQPITYNTSITNMFGLRSRSRRSTDHSTRTSHQRRGLFHRTSPNRRAGGYKVNNSAPFSTRQALLKHISHPGCASEPEHHARRTQTRQA